MRPAFRRDTLAQLMALVTFVCLGAVFIFSKGTLFLMPGPLTSAHGAIKTCNTCHAQSGSGKLSWVHGLVPGDPFSDSKACLTCHKMPDTAFNPHGASANVLEKSTARLTKIAGDVRPPLSARAQNVVFPTHDMVADGLACATCHKEHQGVTFNLSRISNEQCRSCHVVKFNSFDRGHPDFDTYPFKTRTRIIYDHAGHFDKHFPEVAKKDPAKRIPETCSSCHSSRDDRRIMAVAPFEQTCTACHLDQIIGKERASGPKGVAFLSLPGLDLQTLKQKNAATGEWPDGSEAALTPFMQVMIGKTDTGRALLKSIDGVNLQDLSKASDDQIKAVTGLVWEVKTLFYKLISGKASDALGDLNIGNGAKLSASLVADLTANIPRDVLVSAQQQWLPNLASEMSNRSSTGDRPQTGWSPVASDSAPAGSVSPEKASNAPAENSEAHPDAAPVKSETAEPEPSSDASEAAAESGSDSVDKKPVKKVKLDPPACSVRVFGQCLVPKDGAEGAKPDDANAAPESAPKADGQKKKSSGENRPAAMQAGLKELVPAAESEDPAIKADAGRPKPPRDSNVRVADNAPKAKAANTSDDLLFPTPEEQREIDARKKGGPAAGVGTPNGPVSAGGASKAGASGEAPGNGQPRAAPVISIDSGVDPENWAEYGGWYRQDYAIFYRPTGHKDKFVYSWLFLSGPQAPKGDTGPAARVFDALVGKDAQGSCTKCHSVDDFGSKGRLVNFAPPKVETKQGRFTNFIHEPHFGIMENRGCLTCHSLEKGRTYLQSYEQGNPQIFQSNFGTVKKELCQTCHNSSMARQDCLTCHKYHVNGVVTPIMTTKNPMQEPK